MDVWKEIARIKPPTSSEGGLGTIAADLTLMVGGSQIRAADQVARKYGDRRCIPLLDASLAQQQIQRATQCLDAEGFAQETCVLVFGGELGGLLARVAADE